MTDIGHHGQLWGALGTLARRTFQLKVETIRTVIQITFAGPKWTYSHTGF
jgi:hypothetical protein